MPIYEYRCSSCGHELEALQKLSDPPLVACPACQKEALVKLISAAGFQLKGTGWYVTDFKGSSAGKSGSSGSSSGTSTSSEAKPAESKPQTSSEATPAATTTPAASASTPTTGTAS